MAPLLRRTHATHRRPVRAGKTLVRSGIDRTYSTQRPQRHFLISRYSRWGHLAPQACALQLWSGGGSMFDLRHYRGSLPGRAISGNAQRRPAAGPAQYSNSKLKDALPRQRQPFRPRHHDANSARSNNRWFRNEVACHRAGAGEFLPSPKPRAAAYLTKLRYEASASISSGPRWAATSGIGEGAE